jgi:hypothetical protein
VGVAKAVGGLDKQLLTLMSQRFEAAEKAFRMLRKGYVARKETAEKRVVQWMYSKRSLPDPRPLYDEECGWPPGLPLKTKPASLKNICVSGIDDAGRVVVERQHTEFVRQFYETFTDWAAEPVQFAQYSEDDEKDPESVTFLDIQDGRVVASWGTGQEGSSYCVYRCDGGRCVRVDSYEANGKGAKREPPRLLVIARATYTAAGTIERVARYVGEDDEEPEVSFEVRDGKPWWRRR